MREVQGSPGSQERSLPCLGPHPSSSPILELGVFFVTDRETSNWGALQAEGRGVQWKGNVEELFTF